MYPPSGPCIKESIRFTSAAPGMTACLRLFQFLCPREPWWRERTGRIQGLSEITENGCAYEISHGVREIHDHNAVLPLSGSYLKPPASGTEKTHRFKLKTSS